MAMRVFTVWHILFTNCLVYIYIWQTCVDSFGLGLLIVLHTESMAYSSGAPRSGQQQRPPHSSHAPIRKGNQKQRREVQYI